MSKVSLLPQGSTPLMHALDKTGGNALDSIPVDFRTVWDPSTCPLALLPYLAHAFSVDRWSTDWTETQKRQVIAEAWNVHKRKGTVGALRRLIESLGFAMELTEWWQTSPMGERGTFTMTIRVIDTGIDETLYAEIERLVSDAKPLARHLVGLIIELEPRAEVVFAVAVGEVDILTIYPGD